MLATNKIRFQFVVLLLIFTCSSLFAEPVPFKRAIELAITNSAALEVANVDQDRAFAGYLEAKDQFVPQVYLGSGLAYTFGFPLGEPAVFKVYSQSLLYNPAAREFIRAAKTEFRAARFNKEAKRGDVILDTAMTYSDLDRMLAAVSLLRQEETSSLRMEDIVNQRIQAGIESAVEGTRAKLTTARIRLKLAEVETNIETLREHLGALTGLPPRDLETVTESIPKLPEVSQEEDLASAALKTSPVYLSALENANAKLIRATGEHKQTRPQVDLVGQYGYFSKFNNYDQFYKNFKRNNGALGIDIRIPFLNFGQRAHAAVADAEAFQAKKQVELTREQVSTETLKLQRAVAQLSAAREVANLEYQLARADTEAVQGRIENGTATLRDQEQARMVENDKYAALLDTTYDLEKGQMQLLKATGGLEKWALSSH